MSRQVYHVKYKMHFSDDEHGIDVIASNKAEAYDTATYDAIPEKMGYTPYSSWVHSVTYQNGNYRLFNTCEGLAY